MTAHEQTDLFGGTTPVDELELKGHTRTLAEAERELGIQLTADEAGAVIHERRGRHSRDERCKWCQPDGLEALIRLRAKTGPGVSPSEQAGPGTTPTWRCDDCGHQNPAGAIFCRGCASMQSDDPEPEIGGSNHSGDTL